MPTNFPTSLDTFPTAADLSDDTLATKPHSTTHGNLGDAVLAVQTKVGVDNSGVTSTFDYRIRAIENGRGAANGYASLDANTRVPTAQLASGTPTNGYAPVYNGTTVAWAEVTQSNELVDEKDEIVRAGVDGDGIEWNAFDPVKVVESATPGQSARTTVAGYARIDGYRVYVAAGTVSLAAAHASLPRYDLVVAYRNGTLGKVDGTAAATPVPPAVPSYAVGLAWVYRAANDNTVGNAEITDIRVKLTDAWPKQAVRFYEFPEPIGGEYAYGSVIHTGPQLWTGLHGLTYKQWAVFNSADKHGIAAMRSLPHGTWTSVDLMDVTDTPFEASTVNNEHCAYAVAVDSDGRTHVIGNMATSDMDDDANHDTYYARTGTGWSTTFAKAVMDGTASELNSVTYPNFFAQSDGTLYFWHADRTSSTGRDQILRKYAGAGTWSKVGSTVLSDTAWLPYTWWPAVDRWAHNTGSTLDRIHIFWTWREGSATTAEYQEDFYHAYSDDDGVTWKQLSDGSTITHPIGKAETKGRIFNSGQPPVGDAGSWNILNNGGACVDIYGRPHAIVYMGKSGARSTQVLWHIYWDGTAWVTNQLGDFTNGASRAAIFATRDGGVWGLYQNDYYEHRGTIRLVDLDPYSSTYETLTFPIAGPNLDLFSWGPSFDTEAIWSLNELHIPITPQSNGPSASSYQHASNWNSQWGGVLTIDLNQLDKFVAGTAQLPGIEILGTVAASGPNITVLQTSPGDIGVGQFAVTAAYQAQSQVFGRLRAKGSRVGSNSCSVQMLEQTISGTTSSLGRVEFNSTTVDDAETPWVPLRTVTGNTTGHLGLEAWVGASTIGTVSEVTVDVGRWTLPREWA